MIAFFEPGALARCARILSYILSYPRETRKRDPPCCDAQDIDGEDPLKAAIAEPPNFFKAMGIGGSLGRVEASLFSFWMVPGECRWHPKAKG